MNDFHNQVMTASRMNSYGQCRRKHYWRYEVGLRRDSVGLALRIGSAWARGMEARWLGYNYERALCFAIPKGIELSAHETQSVAALLAGYYDYYGESEIFAQIQPEKPFCIKLGNGFTAQGLMDGFAKTHTDENVLVEAKTTGDSVDTGSGYWDRLRFNVQLLQYVDACLQEFDTPIDKVIYDVTRKPSIRPKSSIEEFDAKGAKIVVDAKGVRQFLLKGKRRGEPRQTGDSAKGWVVKSHFETPDEFADRLWLDARARPAFYYARREVTVLEPELESFRAHRASICEEIVFLRDREPRLPRPEDAWPRSVSEWTCGFCDFRSFCLQNQRVDRERPPEGFSIAAFNPELERKEKVYDETLETN